MATILSGTVSSISKFIYQNQLPFSITFGGSPVLDFERTFASTDVTLCYFNQYTVTTSPTSVDVTSLTDGFGNALNFATVKHLHVWNKDAASNLTVGGGTNGLIAALPALVGQAGSSNGSCVNLTTNLTVDPTHKIITLTASAGSIVVDLLIVGS